MFVFFTEIVRKDVVDRHGRWVGRPHDFTAQMGESYPRVTSLICTRGLLRRRVSTVQWKDLHLTPAGFQLKIPIESLEEGRAGGAVNGGTLRTQVLDQQVVDTFNRKVVRVNDLHFLRVDDDLRLAHVDVGIRGLVRRLGFEGAVDGIVRLAWRHAPYLTDESFISWKYVQPLSIQSATGKIQLTVDAKQLKAIPPPDISTMLTEIDPYQRAALLKTMDVGSQVDILTELDLKLQKDLVEELDPGTVVALFERMPADEAADILAALGKRGARRILGQLPAKRARELSALMSHESHSAGGLMTTEFIVLKEGMTVAEAIEHIRQSAAQKKAETIHNAFVVDGEGKLVGSVSFRRLLFEPVEAKMGDVMQVKPPSVTVADPVKEVAWAMDKYNLFTLPVVGKGGAMEGIITVDDVLHIAVEEAWGKRTGL